MRPGVSGLVAQVEHTAEEKAGETIEFGFNEPKKEGLKISLEYEVRASSGRLTTWLSRC